MNKVCGDGDGGTKKQYFSDLVIDSEYRRRDRYGIIERIGTIGITSSMGYDIMSCTWV